MEPSRALGKVHTPFLMNEPMACVRQEGMGQISPGNGVKVRFICLQDVKSPYMQSRESGSLFPWLCMWPGLHACVCVFSCRHSQERKRNTDALSESLRP